MFRETGKGEQRRSLRGSAQQSSKMPGRLPRLRALRPRPQQQQQQRQRAKSDVTADATRRPEGNLKEALVSHEEEVNAKKCSAKKTEDTTMSVATNETDGEDDEDNNVDDNELTMTVVADEEATPDGEIDVDFAMKSEETIDLETERASYECKSCDPPKTLSSIQAYFEHLQKEHKYKVRVAYDAVLPLRFLDSVSLCFALSCSSLFILAIFFPSHNSAVFKVENSLAIRLFLC